MCVCEGGSYLPVFPGNNPLVTYSKFVPYINWCGEGIDRRMGEAGVCVSASMFPRFLCRKKRRMEIFVTDIHTQKSRPI